MSVIMFDAYNTPALNPCNMTDAEAVEVISSMLESGQPVYCRAWALTDLGESVTVFWTTTSRGEAGTVFEHTRHDAFNVPMGDGDRAIEALRFKIQDLAYAQYDRDTEYAVGE
jgi:hypothetical protein